jgi:adenine-specific DNA methylase
MNDKRLIEVAFPLRQASLDSVHEKNVRHGHISTLHIWPARRPLAAARAALIATLLPDPGDPEARQALLTRLGGTLQKTTKKKKMPNGRTEEIDAWETAGGVLHWGRESGPDLDWFREEIRKAYGGRAPRVLDPFAGGGAIPLEAMRLGCEVTAADINPVAWFILKCTLEYPQRLAGQTRRLPDFALCDPDFMSAYFKARGLKPAEIRRHVRALSTAAPAAGVDGLERGENLPLLADPELDPALLDADLAWHVRAWGRWVLKEARRELARFYPTYAEYCALKPYRVVPLDHGEPLRLVPTNEAGEPQIGVLNAGFGADWLENEANPRWVAKPTVAYLWARTVRCKSCRATLPLLKTRWLAKKEHKRVLLTVRPNADRSGVVFGINDQVPEHRGNAAERREHDKSIGAGTMSRAGAKCPCCNTIMTSADLRLEGCAGRLDAMMTAVIADSPDGKEYRLPTEQEIEVLAAAKAAVPSFFSDVPFGIPDQPIPVGASRDGGGSAFTVPLYGLDRWHKLFSHRQLIGISAVLRATRRLSSVLVEYEYSPEEQAALSALLATVLDRVADRGSALCSWTVGWDKIRNTFARFALPMNWDFAETSVLADSSGGYPGGIEWLAQYVEHAAACTRDAPSPSVIRASATSEVSGQFDVVVTDPPYYDAIPYSDLMDFFYVWLRRSLHGLSPELDRAFAEPLSPKWDHAADDGELVDDASRFGGDKAASKRNYEEGMARSFAACHRALTPEGRLVIVFAHKHPDAWETLVAAIIKAGFVVDGSWPIQTEREARTRSLSSAALSSSVWLVCKKRDPAARPGWDTNVLRDMETNIVERLRAFWDAGIRGPDFVWAATGPALEAYSRYPVVKKAAASGEVMAVSEFLGHVRRIVVDFVVGRVLTQGAAEPEVGAHPLDDVTTYYLLHRADFGLKEAPAGPCILYAISCGLSERDLVENFGLLARGKVDGAAADDAPDADDDEGGGDGSSGGKLKLKPWKARTQRGLGEEPPRGRAIPLIDHVHRLLQLWAAADLVRVNAHLDRHGLWRSALFAQLIQALIEQSRVEGVADECAALERLANHVKGPGGATQGALALGD